jgi:hypothetical protein
MYLNKLGVPNIQNYWIYFMDRRVLGMESWGWKSEEKEYRRRQSVKVDDISVGDLIFFNGI